ncbi:hypothetical protein H633G_11608 [Metarhizium anisopliae BRIP 53284]|nr:hypothetical protein H633G_11608 [Metarhizium anisopliae BRIP 53284]
MAHRNSSSDKGRIAKQIHCIELLRDRKDDSLHPLKPGTLQVKVKNPLHHQRSP